VSGGGGKETPRTCPCVGVRGGFLDRKIGLDPRIEPLQKHCCFFDVPLV